uniref:Uncharacterized protein n=1 Tax=Candidatus Kentrum sp. TUN TaxID=2126343 RepID=A0A451A4K2_9GAMM|nr:MAG: hypothetical protein BECKTUN1418D_GA0071000_11399 [Candidatus Kentron sp. TUN]
MGKGAAAPGRRAVPIHASTDGHGAGGAFVHPTGVDGHGADSAFIHPTGSDGAFAHPTAYFAHPTVLAAALASALTGPACDPEPPVAPIAFLQQAATNMDERLLTLLAALGPKAVAANPGLPLRLRARVPDLPRLSIPQRQLLGARIAPLAAGPAQGDGGMGFDRAGFSHHGRLTALAPSQLVLPPELLAWRYLDGGLLYRARTGREPPQLRPTIIVLDTSPACWGVIESLTRPAAHALAESLAHQGMPALFLTTSELHLHPLTQPAQRLQLLTHR